MESLEGVAGGISHSSIPDKVTELPQQMEAPEAIPYVISFANYKQSLCEIQLLGKNKPQKVLTIFKTIGTKVFSKDDFNKCGIRGGPVRNSGDYKRLYNGLSPDIELKEIYLQGTGRIFYFNLESEKKFFVIAITENHYEEDKVKR